MSRLIKQLFADDLLEKSSNERTEYFKKKIISHPLLRDAFDLAKENIEFGADHEIIGIVGPSEVGTTVLARRLYNYYRHDWPVLQKMEAPEAMVCSLGVSAPDNAGRVDGNFWKRLLEALLIQAGDVLYDKKLYVPASQFQLQPSTPYVNLGKQSNDVLMSAVVRMLKLRNTKILIINQAERLFPENDKPGCIRSRQILTDLAALCETRIILVASYEMLTTTCVGGDWLQRRNVVHLRRYNQNDEKDLADFNSTLDELLGHIPCKQRLKRLSEQCARNLYLNSIGRIGSLKKTLDMAVSHSLKTGEEMSEEFILRFAQPNLTASVHAKAAVMGERLLRDVDPKEVERVLDPNWMPDVGIGKPKRSAQSPQPGMAGGSPGRTFGRHIGERKPSRDPVGGFNAKRA